MNWHMRWIGPFSNFQLDIVGFLAVLGEGSVLANAQVAALSRLFYLPRLLPAPQALLRPTRPATLAPTNAEVTAVHSGNHKYHVHHVANILLGGETAPFSVRCVSVQKDRALLEKRRTTAGVLQLNRAKNTPPKMVPPLVKAKTFGPLSAVTLLGSLLAVVLFVVSVARGDGMSMIATLMLAFLSTLIGIGNKWEIKLPKRPKHLVVDGDVVIRYPNGSFLIVKCAEEIARELYFAPEEIQYNVKSGAIYRLISLVGTLMLMLGVIFLANASLELQFCWAGAYIILNAAHWIAAALPQKALWDLSCYVVTEQGLSSGPENLTFTEALWKAIVITRSLDWVKNGKSAPQTPVWDDWLQEALSRARKAHTRIGPTRVPSALGTKVVSCLVYEVPDWDPNAAWIALDKEHNAKKDEQPA